MKTEIIKRENGKINSEYLMIVWTGKDKQVSSGYEMSKDDINNLYVQLSKIVKENTKG